MVHSDYERGNGDGNKERKEVEEEKYGSMGDDRRENRTRADDATT